MELKALIFTTSKTPWWEDEYPFIRRTIEQAKGVTVSTIDVERITLPQSAALRVDGDGDLKPTWEWFKAQFTDIARAKGYNAACWHLTTREFRQLGFKGYNGTYNDDPDDVMEFLIVADRGEEAGGYPYSEFARLFIHELGHGFERWLYGRSSNRVHYYDYTLGAVHEVYREFDFSRWNILYQLRNVARKLRDLLFAKTQERMKYATFLAPAVNRRKQQLVDLMAALGHPITVTEGIRSCARQNELYAKGRSTPGHIVTNARCGESFHQYGVAFDVAFLKDGKPSWSEEHPWQLLGMAGEAFGLEWGGRWTSIEDRPHFQYTGGHSLAEFQAGKVDINKLK